MLSAESEDANGAMLAVTGTMMGFGGALGLSGSMASLVLGTKPSDPLALAPTASVLILAAFWAGSCATSHRVDPIVALRIE